jgi:hypothetical protein
VGWSGEEAGERKEKSLVYIRAKCANTLNVVYWFEWLGTAHGMEWDGLARSLFSMGYENGKNAEQEIPFFQNHI